MNTSIPHPSNNNLYKAASNILDYSFLHLIKDLRNAGIQGVPSEFPKPVKHILSSALLGAINEIMSLIENEEWAHEWEDSSLPRILSIVFGDNGVAEAREFAEEINKPNNDLSAFKLCGMYAARSLIHALTEEKNTHDEWLETYEGIFLATARLHKII